MIGSWSASGPDERRGQGLRSPAIKHDAHLGAGQNMVQIRFPALSILQLIFGAAAVGMAVAPLRAREAGCWP
jgi:hypothetical protein